MIFFIFMGTISYAQEVIATSGEVHTASDTQLSWTLGEVVIETATIGATILTQGFHQPMVEVTNVTKLLKPETELTVFPNPATKYVTLKLSENINGFHYTVFDITGKVIEQNQIMSNSCKVDVEGYKSGAYLLKVSDLNNKPVQTFKLVKE